MVCAAGMCVPRGSQPCGTTTCQYGFYCASPINNMCCEQGRRACGHSCCERHETCVDWRNNQCAPVTAEQARRQRAAAPWAGYGPGGGYPGGGGYYGYPTK